MTTTEAELQKLKINTQFQQGWHCMEWNLPASSEFSAMSMYYFHNLQKNQSKIFFTWHKFICPRNFVQKHIDYVFKMT